MKRRTFISTTLFGLAACRTGLAQQCRPTTADIEGPFFRPGAPLRHAMVAQRAISLHLHGTVMDARCQPVANAELELWQADMHGRYDLHGFHHRARVRTDREGQWYVDTIIPGRYLNGGTYRPAHIHAKVHARGRSLTTQLYFPDDPYNDADPWFDASRLVRLDGGRARFDFVL